MTQKDLINQIMYLAKDPHTLGYDEDPLEVILNWLSIQDLESIRNSLEQLYLKDLINQEFDNVQDVSITDAGTYLVTYDDGSEKEFQGGLDKDILSQANWNYLHNDYYIREVK